MVNALGRLSFLIWAEGRNLSIQNGFIVTTRHRPYLAVLRATMYRRWKAAPQTLL
jgi:hypothetical protein